MNSGAIKSLVICAFGVAAIAGCASSPSTPAVASSQRSVHTGKVVAVENMAAIDQTTAASSSGSSVVTTTASGGPSVVTVQFNDGSQGKYIIEHPSMAHPVGQPVYVITDADRITISSP